jgi:hypothetical protein
MGNEPHRPGGRSDRHAARERLAEALDAFDSFEMRAQWLGCLEDHARLALRLGTTDDAVGLAAATQRFRDSAGLIRSPHDQSRWQEFLDQLRSAVADEAFERHWQQGLTWDGEQVKRLARGLTRPAQ